jgi:putative membrane protein
MRRRQAGRTSVAAVFVRFLLIWLLSAVAFAITSWVLPGMDVSGGFFGYLWVSLLFGLVNGIIGTLLRLFTLPLIFLTLGLFSLVVTALMLQLTDSLSSHLTIDEFFWTAIWAALILACINVLLDLVVRGVIMRQSANDLR